MTKMSLKISKYLFKDIHMLLDLDMFKTVQWTVITSIFFRIITDRIAEHLTLNDIFMISALSGIHNEYQVQKLIFS